MFGEQEGIVHLKFYGEFSRIVDGAVDCLARTFPLQSQEHEVLVAFVQNGQRNSLNYGFSFK